MLFRVKSDVRVCSRDKADMCDGTHECQSFFMSCTEPCLVAKHGRKGTREQQLAPGICRAREHDYIRHFPADTPGVWWLPEAVFIP